MSDSTGVPLKESRAGARDSPRQPLPRYRRERADVSGDSLPGFALQERDIALLEDIWRYRLLATGQLELLRACDADPAKRFVSRLTLTRRLKLLFHHGYLGRIARPLAKGSLEPVYVLDGEGAKALRKRHGEIGGRRVAARSPSQRPKSAALEHLLAVNQFRIALSAACQASEFQSLESSRVRLHDWKGSDEVKFQVARAERGERTRLVTLMPDGFFSLQAKDQKLFYFLEVDLGSESARILADKCRSYYAYWQSGGFAHDFSVPREVGFRVVLIAPSARRADTILKAIQGLETGRGLFLTALEETVMPCSLLGPTFRSGATGASTFLV